MAIPHSKNAYLNESDVLDRIQQGQLDAYDIIYTRDTHACFIVSPDLVPIEIRNRVYQFSSEDEAVTTLNENTDSYEGQIISVLVNEKYEGYVVNKNYNNKFYITPLSQSSAEIDYDTIGNRPIINLTGTLDKKIIVDELDSGTYYIDGIYKISEKEDSQYASAVKNIFLVERIDEKVYIKKLSAVGITDYTVDDTVSRSDVVTIDYLKENGYITSDYVDTRLSELDYITKEEAETYITEVINNTVDDLVDKKIDQKLDEKLQPVSNEQVYDLFS